MTNQTTAMVTSGGETPKRNMTMWAELRRRASTLDIPYGDLVACSNSEELKQLAKKYYRIKLKKCHPDVHRRTGGRRTKYGGLYNQVLKAYRWIEDLDDARIFATLKNRVSVPDPELPLDWGLGWREYDTHYAGFTVLSRL